MVPDLTLSDLIRGLRKSNKSVSGKSKPKDYIEQVARRHKRALQLQKEAKQQRSRGLR